MHRRPVLCSERDISLHIQRKEDSRMHFEEWLLVSSVMLLLSILAWKVSSRLGIPALLLFLGIGMLAGSDGPGGIYFDDASVAQSVGVVALAFILFAGGLDTEWKVVRRSQEAQPLRKTHSIARTRIGQ